MKLKFVFFSLLVIYSLTSCKKEVITQTQADQTTTELQKIIKDNAITRVIAWDDKSGFPSNIPVTLGSYWSFSNGFITIGGYGGNPDTYTRNLLYLDRYEISSVSIVDGTTPIALILHFDS